MTLLRNPLHRGRCAGTVAALAACLLAVQSAGLSLLTAPAGPECCCAHRDAQCRCKVCEHARQLASGHPCLKSCGATPQDSVALIHLDPVVPPPTPLATTSPPVARVESLAAVPPLEPPLEVPTPPPLAAI